MRSIRIFFTLLWFGTLGSFTAPFAFVGAHMGPTNHCIIRSVKDNLSAGFIAILLYDTSVFTAISIRLLLDNNGDGWVAKMKMFVRGNKMGYVSKALLQSGQTYYL